MQFIYSLKWRIITTVLITYLLFFGLMMGDVVSKQRQAMVAQLASKAEDVATLLAMNAAVPMLNNDINAMKELINSMHDRSDIDMVFLLDARGRVRASQPESYFNQVLTDLVSRTLLDRFAQDTAQRSVQQQQEGVIDTLVPIRVHETLVGYSRILVTTEPITHQIERLVWDSIAYVLLAMLLGGVLVWLVIRSLLAKLEVLAQAAKQIYHDDFSVSLPRFIGKDEVATLGRAFSTMVASVKQQIDLLAYQASHDGLTKLPNRTYLIEHLTKVFVQIQQNQQGSVAILLIDLDRFKEVNDSYGHAVGDQLLVAVADLFSRQLHDQDSVIRLGGDEFCIIIEHVADMAALRCIAKKLIDSLKTPLFIEQRELFISCSVGISVYPDDALTPETLLRNADTAMYKAKAQGRNRYQFYTEDMTRMAYERIQLELGLRKALKHNEFVVFYQPQIDASSSKLIGLEGLVRWHHPEQGLIPPMQFLPLAEETGLIIAIDRLVMKQAVMQLVSWRRLGLEPGVMSLNLSFKQLRQSNFVGFLTELLKTHDCRPEWIELEITEGEVMADPERMIVLLSEIRALGISLAIDDFGTGYSSLAYLKRLPVNKIKIDQSFVKALPQAKADGLIVDAMQSLAKSFEMRCIAEGVETPEQRDYLLGIGCTEMQGYLYSKPIPAAEAEVFIRQYAPQIA